MKQSLPTRFPHIEAVFGADDRTAIGAELAARRRGRNEMIIADVDGSPDTIAALKQFDSRIMASASQDPSGMAKQATAFALDIMRGKTPLQAVTLLNTKLVTKDSAATVKGWDAPLRERPSQRLVGPNRSGMTDCSSCTYKTS